MQDGERNVGGEEATCLHQVGGKDRKKGGRVPCFVFFFSFFFSGEN